MKKIVYLVILLGGLCFLLLIFQPKPANKTQKKEIGIPSVDSSEYVEKRDTQKSPTRIPSSYQTSFERKSREMGIIIGTPADDVLAIRRKPPYPSEVVGKDANGLIVEWEYRDGIYVMRIWTIDGVTCYRVAEMKL